MNDFEKLREALSGDEIFKPASPEEVEKRFNFEKELKKAILATTISSTLFVLI